MAKKSKKPQKLGRPAVEPEKKQSVVIGVKVTPSESETLAAAAAKAGKPLRTWGREVLLRAAEKVLGER